MSTIVSKVGVHCIGPKRDGYGPFLETIHAAGRRLAIVKVRDEFSAIDEALALWPDVLTVGAFTEWDDAGYDVMTAYDRITAAAALKPGIKFWEYFNERNGDYQQQADLYIALLPMLALKGIGLCLFNCASGTPFRPGEGGGEGDFAYAQIARVCKFAKDNGYRAILGLHEYFSDDPTIGRFVTMADYLEAHNALIPIAITEYGMEVCGTETRLYLDTLKALDPLYMQDPRVAGAATWTLGGGGWSGSNFEDILPDLGAYIASVVDTTPESEPTMKGGLHLSANGNHSDDLSLPLEIQAMQTAKLTHCKFMSNGDPEFVHVLEASGVDLANSLCRLYAAGDNEVLKDPARFYLEQRAYITEVYGHGVRLFEIHNEPNLESEGFGFAWSTPADFAANFYGPVARLIRDNFPGVKLVYPGLSPQPDWATWKPSISSLISQGLIDLIGVHCYWDSAVNMRSAEQGRTFERFADMGRSLIITEVSHNVNNVSDAQKGAEYAEYLTALPNYVIDCFFFVSYGPGYDGSGETWVRGDPPALTAIPAAVGAGGTIPPVNQYVFQHYHLDVGAAVSNKTVQITMNAAHTIVGDYGAVVPPPKRFFLVASVDPAGAGTVTLNPPQPADGYVEGTVVTVTFS